MLFIYVWGCGNSIHPAGWVQGELGTINNEKQSTEETRDPDEDNFGGTSEWYGEFSGTGPNMDGFVEYIQFDEEDINCFIVLYAEETTIETDCSDCTLAFSFDPIVEIEVEENCHLDTENIEDSLFYGYGEEQVFRKIENQWLSQGEAGWAEEDQMLWFSHE